MSGIKQLAGQTLWYGASSIIARFLNYLLTPLLLLKLSKVEYGEMTLVYAAIPFLNIIFTYGLETSYFRFVKKGKEVYHTLSISLITTTLILAAVLYLFRKELANILSLEEHINFISWGILIIALDTLSTLPFAKLRQEGKPRKYAFIKILGIFVNIALVFFFYYYCPQQYILNPTNPLLAFYNPNAGAEYVFIANFFQAIITLLLLLKELLAFKIQFNTSLWKEVIMYSLPLTIAGLGGMINETFSRIMLGWWLPGTSEQVKAEIGTFGAVYKLSILISLFIQAFRLGAEPFFFKQSEGQNPQRTYARVLKFFVITLCFMFLIVALYLDIWKYFITNHSMWEGLKVVPILLLANIFLGIYYNLSIWYKLSDKTMAGVYITLIGAALTLVANWLLIPFYGYVGSAWATLFCYGSMMVISFVWGQKEYYIPYPWKKLTAYIVIVILLFLIYEAIIYLTTSNLYLNIATATILTLFFVWLIIRVEKKELQRLPLIGKYISR